MSFTQYGGADERMVNNLNALVPQNSVTGVGSNGIATLSTVGNGIPGVLQPGQIGYPRDNSINGNPQYQLTAAEVNSEYDFSDNLSVYAFGTIGHKFGKSFENYRLPSQIIATAGSNQPCTAANPDGYNTGSSTINGLTPNCSGPFAIATANGFSAFPGTPGGGLNPATGTVISSGQAGNLFSAHMTNAQTGPGSAEPPRAETRPWVRACRNWSSPAPTASVPWEVLKEDDYQ